MPSTGWGTVTVPGAVSLWMTLHARYGKLPFADLFEPAIKYAHDGFRVSYMVARQWARAVDRLRGQQDWVRDFMPNGRTPQTGELWKFPDQAKTLTKIAELGGEAFYRGELAEAMDSHARATGGGLRLNDLAEHKADWVDPIGLTYRGVTLHEIPPSGQGIAACMALGILENFDVAGHDGDGSEVAHLKIEAMKLAFADIWRYVADPRFMDITPAQMLDKHYLKSRAKLIDPKKAKEFGPGAPEGRRHDLSRRRRRIGHDGVADPVELHGLRLGHRGAGHRHRSPEPGERVRDDQGSCQRGRSEETAVPHHHPRLHHQGRQAGRDLRPDGRRHAAAGPHAGLLAHRRLRPQSAGRHRRRRAGACTSIDKTVWSRSTCRPTR